MANISVTNTTAMGGGNTQIGTSAAYTPLISIWNSTIGVSTVVGALRRGKLYDILVGTNGTPADNYMEWECVRAQIGSTIAPQLAGGISSLSSNFGLDVADCPTGTANQIFINSSIASMANATFTTEVWYVGVNQRASYRWVAAPGSEIVWPAVSSATTITGNGISGRTRSAAYTGTATMNMLWQEQ